MSEFLYDVNSALIAVILFVSMAVAIEIGLHIGLKSKRNANEASRTHINAIQGSILGILALLLGFTFSLSLQRFDSRSDAVVDEANAIGTAYLRAQLLPPALRDPAQAQMRAYVDVRVRAGEVTLVDRAAQQALLAEAARMQSALWRYALQSAEAEMRPPMSVLFIEAVNAAFDSFGKRVAALDRHVPEVVLLLLYGTFLMAGAIVGFSAGVGGHRPSLASYIMVALIVVLVFIILDLDRPRRGLILVSQQPMLQLQSSMKAAPLAPAQQEISK